jgi:hypothetical protein
MGDRRRDPGMNCCDLDQDPNYPGGQQLRIEQLLGDIEQLGAADR